MYNKSVMFELLRLFREYENGMCVRLCVCNGNFSNAMLTAEFTLQCKTIQNLLLLAISVFISKLVPNN